MDDFVLNWKKALGWREDPFEPAATSVEYLGGYENEREKLNLFILKCSKFGTVIGKQGAGKTIIIHWLKANLSKHKGTFKVVTLDNEDLKSDEKTVRTLIEPFTTEHPIRGMLEKRKIKSLTKNTVDQYLKEHLKSKRYILLVEDAHLLKRQDIEMIHQILEINNTAVILSGRKELSKIHLKHLGKDELGFELKKLSFAGAKEMIRKRVESVGGTEIWPFTDKILKDLFSIADYNPSKILQLCQERVKELAIEVKSGKILEPEKKNGKNESDHVYSWNKEIKHPEVKKKHKKHGFGIVFNYKDDDELKQEKDKRLEQEQKAQDKSEKEEAKKEEIIDEKDKIVNIDEEKKKQEKKEAAIPEKKEEHTIVIDLGYTETTKSKKSTHKQGKEIVVKLDNDTHHAKPKHSKDHKHHKKKR
ncbi:MAG: ATP-binding protein [Nanoarchaeota archaeon]|nr:ATP-binding protein [Nanoarchaeota archaeon]